MQQQEQRKLDSLRRVQDFLDAHADAVGALRSSEGRALLDEAVATLSAHNAEQAATDRSLAGAKERQQDNEHTLGVMLRDGRLLELNGSILE